MAADLAHRHAARIHRDDLVVEVREAALIFGDQLRIEASRPVARDRQRHLRRAGQNRLLRMAVAAVGACPRTLSSSRCSSSSAFRIRSESAFFSSSTSPSLANTSFGSRPARSWSKKFLLDRHVMILPFHHHGLTHKIPDSPDAFAKRQTALKPD